MQKSSQCQCDVTLKEYFEALLFRIEENLIRESKHLVDMISALEKRYDQGSGADRMAVSVALESVNERLKNVNEFRAMINDIVSHLMPRPEAENRFKELEKKIEAITKIQDSSEGRGAGYQKSWAIIVAVVVPLAGIAGAIISAWIRR